MMAKFSVDEIRRRMASPENVRAMSVIAHVDHGKTTLTDCLLSHCGLIPENQAGEKRKTDTGSQEIERGVTIKSTAVSMCYDHHQADEKGETSPQPHLIHLIDSPGHVDFSSEVTAALRITDGALVVVDCIEGVCVQTETVLRQAISEGIKPVLFLNKLDRIFLEVDMDLEKAYLTFRNAIEQVNRVVSIYSTDGLKFEVVPEHGTVGFGSGLHNWAFTLNTFADFYAKKFDQPKAKWMKRLWGDNFYDTARNVWTKKRVGDSSVRGFCHFVLRPIQELCKAVMPEGKDKWNAKKLKKLKKMFGLIFKNSDLETVLARRRKLKDVLKHILSHWLRCGETLLGMICDHLPSPVEAQKYRFKILYDGPNDDRAATSIANCDPDGAIMFYVSKMIPSSAKGRFYCLGRLFSGTLRPGQGRIRILGPDFHPEHGTKDLAFEKVQRAVTMMADQVVAVDVVPCGNIVGLVGIDKYVNKNATLTDCEDAHIIKSMKFSVSPVVRRTVEPKRPQDLPKLVSAIRDLVKSDNLVQHTMSKNGEHVIAGAGELHLETVLHDLEHEFMKDVPIVVGKPVVSYCESIAEECKEICLSKSKSKLNRLLMTAEPLGEELTAMVESGDVTIDMDKSERTKVLTKKFDWDLNDSRKIWAFGADGDAKCNILVNQTTAAQYLNEIRDSIVSGFHYRVEAGVLCEEPLRGVKFNLMDAKVHSDPAHRKSGEILPTASRVMAACQLACKPIILEPVYRVAITVPMNQSGGVYKTISARRGEITDVQDRIGTPLCEMKAFLPVSESFGFSAQLRALTRGQAFPQMTFSHWQAVSGDVYEEGSPANVVVMEIRKRKGLSQKLPKLDDFNDRL